MTGFLDGITINHTATRAAEADKAEATCRLAATTVRKLTMPHDRRCPGICSHRNHRRDRFHNDLLRDALELDDGCATAGDYDSQLDWAAVSRRDLRTAGAA
jgi:hypothetical protein